LFEDGLGVTQDFVEAAKWFRLAAEQGVAEAQYSLGFLFEKGFWVDKDPVEAAKWYRLAAEQNDQDAIDALKELQKENGKKKDDDNKWESCSR
jgi:hypothetical protein